MLGNVRGQSVEFNYLYRNQLPLEYHLKVGHLSLILLIYSYFLVNIYTLNLAKLNYYIFV